MNANQRADRWAAAWVTICAGCLLWPIFVVPGCKTGPNGGPDWQAIEVEIGLAADDLRNFADIAEGDADGDGAPDHPERAEQFRELAGHLDTIERGVAAYNAGAGVPADLSAAIDAALLLASEAVDPEDRVYVALAAAVLRRVQAYLPEEGA